VLTLSGSLIALVFLVQTVIAMAQRSTGWFEFWSWAAAAETAAWRLKWISIPVLFVVLWLGRKLYRSIRLQPARFCGLKQARYGLLTSTTVAFLIALLIGITVPARLRQRQLAKEAGFRADYHTFEAALLQYRAKYHTYPADFKDLRDRIADPYGSLAAVLDRLDPNGYRPSADVAAIGTEKSRTMQGVAIRKAAFSTADDTPPGGLAFTKYDFRMPGEDKILFTDDDWIVQDGVLKRLSDVADGGVGRSVSAGALQP
jgi:hypothetical protein